MKQQSRGLGKLSAGLFAFIACLVFSATTYVIKEGGQEVGHYEEQDGRSDVRVIDNEKPAPRPAPASPNDEDMLPAQPRVTWKGPISSLTKDPEFVAYLQSQPWMIKLREWDQRYGVGAKLEKNREWLKAGIFVMVALLFFLQALALFSKQTRKKSAPQEPILKQTEPE